MVSKDLLAAARFSPEKMQKVNLFETRNFFCDIYGLEPGQEQVPHAHPDADKLYYVLAGNGIFIVDDDERDLGPQQIIFAPAGASHGVRNAGPGRLTLLVFMTPNPNFK